MKKLVKKEISVISKHLLNGIMLPVLAIIVAALDKTTAYSMFILSIAFISSSTIYYSIRDDKKANSDMLFNSFPIDRSESFIGKYIVYFLVPLFYSIVLYVSVLGLRKSGHPIFFMTEQPSLGLDLVILSLAFSLILLSVLIPLLYKDSKYGTAMAVIIAALYLLAARQGGSIVPKILFSPPTWIVLLVISIVVYLVSLGVMMNMVVKE